MLIRGKYVITDASLGEAGVLRDAAIYVCDDKIVEVGSYKELKEKYPEETVLGNGEQLLMPGLIDAHTHGSGVSLVQRGETLDFLENSQFDFDSAMDFPPELNSAMLAYKHIRNGGTMLHHNNCSPAMDENEIFLDETKIEAYQRTGIRLAFSPGVRNQAVLCYDDKNFHKTLPPDLQERTRYMLDIDEKGSIQHYLDTVDYLYKKYNGDQTRIFFGPTWIQGCTEDFLLAIRDRAKAMGNLPIHFHCLQTPVQKAYGIYKHGKSLVQYLDDLNMVDKNLVLGHAVYLNQEDIELMASKGATITHHASCNLVMRNGIAPVLAMLDAGMPVAMGLDEKSINDDEDVFMEMRMIYMLHRVNGRDLSSCKPISPSQAMTIATKNGAAPCGFAGEVGTLAPGQLADCILVDMKEIMEDPWTSPDAPLFNLVLHRALGRYVDTVVIGGKTVMKDRKMLTIDVEALYAEARAYAAKGKPQAAKDHRKFLYEIKPHVQRWYNGWQEKIEDDWKPYYIMNSRK